MTIQTEKQMARQAGFARRKQAFESVKADLVSPILKLAKDAQIVASYMPMRTEIDPMPAMQALYEMGKKIVVPVILGKAMPLKFHEWTPEADMIEGEFGALIPKSTQAMEPDLVLAPMVAFDARGTRLGYGGGFYDRTIEALRLKSNVPYIGLAFEAQCAEAPLPVEATDIQLNGIVTENGYREFS